MKRSGIQTIVLILILCAPVSLMLAQAARSPQAPTEPSARRLRPVRRPAASPNGTYQIAIYDSFEFASGGRVVVEDEKVTSIAATYFNWDKVNVDGASVCREIFTLNHAFEPPISLDDLEQGVTVEENYEGGAKISFTIKLAVVDAQALVGTVDAVGTGFKPLLDGCNGTFAQLTIWGGKSQ